MRKYFDDLPGFLGRTVVLITAFKSEQFGPFQNVLYKGFGVHDLNALHGIEFVHNTVKFIIQKPFQQPVQFWQEKMF